MSDLFPKFVAVDRGLASRGVPPTGPRWLDAIRTFYLDPTARELLGNVGRGGVKSTTGVKMAITEVLAGDFAIPPGERHYFVLVSENAEEARKSLRQLRSYLDMLGEKHTGSADTIELVRRPERAFKVLACRVGAVSGFRCIGWTADECAKWSNEDGSNPAAEVVASLRAMTITHRTARGRLFSTPVGQLGFFYDRLTQGDTARQVVTRGPSWDFNPTITEEMTREIEPDPRVWAREYLAEPQGSLLQAFDPDDVAHAIRDPGEHEEVGNMIGVADTSAGKGDAWTWARGGFCQQVVLEEDRWRYVAAFDNHGNISVKHGAILRDEHGNPIPNPDFEPPRTFLRIDGLRALTGRFSDRLDAETVQDLMARDAAQLGLDRFIGDSYSEFMLTAGLARRRLVYVPLTWTQESKARAVGRLRQLFRERRIVIAPGPEAEHLRRELVTFQERVSPSGLLTYGARRGGHDDRVALLINLAMADTDGLLHGSPIRKDRTRLSRGDAMVDESQPAFRGSHMNLDQLSRWAQRSIGGRGSEEP